MYSLSGLEQLLCAARLPGTDLISFFAAHQELDLAAIQCSEHNGHGCTFNGARRPTCDVAYCKEIMPINQAIRAGVQLAVI